MKKIIIATFLLVSLNGFSQITFKGTNSSTVLTNNESKKTVVKKELSTSNINEEEVDPSVRTVKIIQNKESKTYGDKVIVKTDKDVDYKEPVAETDPNAPNKVEVKSVDYGATTGSAVSNSQESVLPDYDSKQNSTSYTSKVNSVNNSLEKPTSTVSETISDDKGIFQKELDPLEFEEVKVTDVQPKNVELEDFKAKTVKAESFKAETVKVDDLKVETKVKKVKTKKVKQPKSKIAQPEVQTAYAPTKIEKEELEGKTENSNPKKGSWSIGVGAGLPVILGEMDSRFGYGANFYVQKAIGHVFSLRLHAIALETFGRDSELNTNGYSNYKTRMTDYTLQGVFTLNNLSFYKKEPKVIYNLIAGAGLATMHSWKDNLDENAQRYAYDAIPRGDRKATNNALNQLLDKNYETIIAKDENAMSIKNTSIVPTIAFGAGVTFKLSNVVDLNVESRMSYHFNDNLDAHTRGIEKDWLSFTTLGFVFKIPSKNGSMMWSNPVYSNIEEIAELKKKVDKGDLLVDEDKDGIADIFDQDLNTPAKVAVDSRGVPTDMDKDGVPDYKDSQPFTPIGAEVDIDGIAIDTDNDGVADILDMENNTLPGKQVDANGRTFKETVREVVNVQKETDSDFDLVFFDENSHKVKKEFYSILYDVKKYVTKEPTAKIQIVGHTDVNASDEYNLNLSEKRANAVYSILKELFKVPSSNLVTTYLGKQEPLVQKAEGNTNSSPIDYLNRRVEFRIIK